MLYSLFTSMDSLLAELLFLTSPKKEEKEVKRNDDAVIEANDFFAAVALIILTVFCVFLLTIVCCRRNKRPVKDKILARSIHKVTVHQYTPTEWTGTSSNKKNKRNKQDNSTCTSETMNKSNIYLTKSSPDKSYTMKLLTDKSVSTAQGDHSIIVCSPLNNGVHSKTALEERVFLCQNSVPRSRIKQTEDISKRTAQTDTSKSIIVLKRSIFSKTNRPAKREEIKPQGTTKLISNVPERNKEGKIEGKERKTKVLEPGIKKAIEISNQRHTKKEKVSCHPFGNNRHQRKPQGLRGGSSKMTKLSKDESSLRNSFLPQDEHINELKAKSPFTKICLNRKKYINVSPTRKIYPVKQSSWQTFQNPNYRELNSKRRNVRLQRRSGRNKTDVGPINPSRQLTKPSQITNKWSRTQSSPPSKSRTEAEIKSNYLMKRILDRTPVDEQFLTDSKDDRKNRTTNKQKLQFPGFSPESRDNNKMQFGIDGNTHFAAHAGKKYPNELSPILYSHGIKNKEKVVNGMRIQRQERSTNPIQYGVRLGGSNDKLIKANVSQLCKTTSNSKLYTSLVRNYNSEKKQYKNYAKKNSELALHLFYGINDSYRKYKNEMSNLKQRKSSKQLHNPKHSPKLNTRNKSLQNYKQQLLYNHILKSPTLSGKSKDLPDLQKKNFAKKFQNFWTKNLTIGSQNKVFPNPRNQTLQSFLDEKELETNETSKKFHTREESTEGNKSSEKKIKKSSLSKLSSPRTVKNVTEVNHDSFASSPKHPLDKTVLPIEVTEDNIHPILDLLKNQREKERNDLIQYFAGLTPSPYFLQDDGQEKMCERKKKKNISKDLSCKTAPQNVMQNCTKQIVKKSNASSDHVEGCNKLENYNSYTVSPPSSKSNFLTKERSIYSFSSPQPQDQPKGSQNNDVEQDHADKIETVSGQVKEETNESKAINQNIEAELKTKQSAQSFLSSEEIEKESEHTKVKCEEKSLGIKSPKRLKCTDISQCSVEKDLESKISHFGINKKETPNTAQSTPNNKTKKIKNKPSPCLSERIQASLSTLRRETIAFRNKMRPALQGKKGKIIKGNNTFGEKIQSQTYSEIKNAMNQAKNEKKNKKFKLPNQNINKADSKDSFDKNLLWKNKIKKNMKKEVANDTSDLPKHTKEPSKLPITGNGSPLKMENSFTTTSYKNSKHKRSPFGNLINPVLSCEDKSVQHFNSQTPSPRLTVSYSSEHVQHQFNLLWDEKLNLGGSNSPQRKNSKKCLQSKINSPSTPANLSIENYSSAQNDKNFQDNMESDISEKRISDALDTKALSLSLHRPLLNTDAYLDDYSVGQTSPQNGSPVQFNQTDKPICLDENYQLQSENTNVANFFLNSLIGLEKVKEEKNGFESILEVKANENSENDSSKTIQWKNQSKENHYLISSSDSIFSDFHHMAGYENVSDLLDTPVNKTQLNQVNKIKFGTEPYKQSTFNAFDFAEKNEEIENLKVNNTSTTESNQQVINSLSTFEKDEGSNSLGFLDWNLTKTSLMKQKEDSDGYFNSRSKVDKPRVMQQIVNDGWENNLMLNERKNENDRTEILTSTSFTNNMTTFSNCMDDEIASKGDVTLKNIIYDLINAKASENISEDISNEDKTEESFKEAKQNELDEITLPLDLPVKENNKLNDIKTNAISLQDFILAILQSKSGIKVNKHSNPKKRHRESTAHLKRCVKQSFSMETTRNKGYITVGNKFGSFHKPWGIKKYISGDYPVRFSNVKEYKGMSFKGNVSQPLLHTDTKNSLTQGSNSNSFYNIKGLAEETGQVTNVNQRFNDKKDFSECLEGKKTLTDFNYSHITLSDILDSSKCRDGGLNNVSNEFKEDICNNDFIEYACETQKNIDGERIENKEGISYSDKQDERKEITQDQISIINKKAIDSKLAQDPSVESLNPKLNLEMVQDTSTALVETEAKTINGTYLGKNDVDSKKLIESNVILDTFMLTQNPQETRGKEVFQCNNFFNENKNHLKLSVMGGSKMNNKICNKIHPFNEENPTKNTQSTRCPQQTQPVPAKRSSNLRYSFNDDKDCSTTGQAGKLSPRKFAINNQRGKLSKMQKAKMIRRPCQGSHRNDEGSHVINHLPPLSPSPDRNLKSDYKHKNKQTEVEKSDPTEKSSSFCIKKREANPNNNVGEIAGSNRGDLNENDKNSLSTKTVISHFSEGAGGHRRFGHKVMSDSYKSIVKMKPYEENTDTERNKLNNHPTPDKAEESLHDNHIESHRNFLTQQYQETEYSSLQKEEMRNQQAITQDPVLRKNSNIHGVESTTIKNTLNNKHQCLVSHDNIYEERKEQNNSSYNNEDFSGNKEKEKYYHSYLKQNSNRIFTANTQSFPLFSSKGENKIETKEQKNSMQDLESILLSEIDHHSAGKYSTGHVFWDNTSRRRRQIRSLDQNCEVATAVVNASDISNRLPERQNKPFLKEYRKLSHQSRTIDKVKKSSNKGDESSNHSGKNNISQSKQNTTIETKEMCKSISKAFQVDKAAALRNSLTDPYLKNDLQGKVKKEFQIGRKALIETSDKPNSKEAVKSAKRLAGTLEEYLLSSGQDEKQMNKYQREFKHHASYTVLTDSKCSNRKAKSHKSRCSSERFLSKRKSLDNQIHKSISERISEFSQYISSTNEAGDIMETLDQKAKSDGSLSKCPLKIDEKATNPSSETTQAVRRITPFNKVAKRVSKTSVMSSDIDLSWAESTLESTFTWLTELKGNDNTNHTDYYIQEEEIIIKNSSSPDNILSEEELNHDDIFENIEEISFFESSCIGNDLKSFLLFHENSDSIDTSFANLNDIQTVNNENETSQNNVNQEKKCSNEDYQDHDYEMSTTSSGMKFQSSCCAIGPGLQSLDTSTCCKTQWTKLGDSYVISAWSHEMCRKDSDLFTGIQNSVE